MFVLLLLTGMILQVNNSCPKNPVARPMGTGLHLESYDRLGMGCFDHQSLYLGIDGQDFLGLEIIFKGYSHSN